MVEYSNYRNFGTIAGAAEVTRTSFKLFLSKDRAELFKTKIQEAAKLIGTDTRVHINENEVEE